MTFLQPATHAHSLRMAVKAVRNSRVITSTKSAGRVDNSCTVAFGAMRTIL